jgi:hypothetical protein
MSTFRNPVGPQSSSTYWRRRLVVGLGLVAVIVVIFLIAFRPGGATPTAGESNAPTDAATPAADATDAAVVPDGECTPAVVKVEPITDAGDYSAEQQPLLSLSITNIGTTACTFNAGSDVQEYVITSGEEQIWSSKDCQTDAVAAATQLQPGVAVTTTPFAWDRTRSDPASCDATRTAVTASGASYHLNVTVNGVASADSKQFLLN